MFNPKLLDDVAKKISENLPSGVQEIQEDIEKHIRSAVQTGLAKLDLVTREEFDVQSEVLARTRMKLEALDAKIKSLEEQLSSPNKDRLQS